MATHPAPEIGHWYTHRDQGLLFQVVAFDEDEGLVEMQDFDGGLDEVDLETWYEMPIDAAEAPEDYTGAVDDVDAPAEFAAAGDGGGRDWRAPVDDLPDAPQDLVESEPDDDEDFERR